jgi:hypothetical protein
LIFLLWRLSPVKNSSIFSCNPFSSMLKTSSIVYCAIFMTTQDNCRLLKRAKWRGIFYRWWCGGHPWHSVDSTCCLEAGHLFISPGTSRKGQIAWRGWSVVNEEFILISDVLTVP